VLLAKRFAESHLLFDILPRHAALCVFAPLREIQQKNDPWLKQSEPETRISPVFQE